MAKQADYFRRLAELLQEHGYQWVLAEALAQIAEGMTVDKDVREFEAAQIAEASFELRPRGRKRARLIATVPYDDSQKLDILLNAIEAALVQRADLEEAVLKSLQGSKDEEAIEGVEFVPDQEMDPAGGSVFRRHELRPDRRQANQVVRETAARTLAEIRADA
jgi:hypothetical protein